MIVILFCVPCISFQAFTEKYKLMVAGHTQFSIDWHLIFGEVDEGTFHFQPILFFIKRRHLDNKDV